MWKGETLEILPERRPGDQQQTSDQSGIKNCHMESICTWWQQLEPHLEEPSQRQPMTWPRCLGRGIHLNLPTSPKSVAQPIPSSSSSDSSGPPSLESITEPESGYEVSVSSASDTEWEKSNSLFLLLCFLLFNCIFSLGILADIFFISSISFKNNDKWLCLC